VGRRRTGRRSRRRKAPPPLHSQRTEGIHCATQGTHVPLCLSVCLQLDCKVADQGPPHEADLAHEYLLGLDLLD
jgi:hypothetical protein